MPPAILILILLVIFTAVRKSRITIKTKSRRKCDRGANRNRGSTIRPEFEWDGAVLAACDLWIRTDITPRVNRVD